MVEESIAGPKRFELTAGEEKSEVRRVVVKKSSTDCPAGADADDEAPWAPTEE